MVDLAELANAIEAESQQCQVLKLTLPILVPRKEWVMLRLFPAKDIPITLHYDEVSYKDYFLCLGGRDRCPACFARVKTITFRLLPVINIMEGLINLLRIPSSSGPESLAAQIAAIQRGKHHTDQLVSIRKDQAKDRFEVTTEPLADKGIGNDLIAVFNLNEQGGLIDFASSFPVLTDEEVVQIPSIGRVLAALGWKRKKLVAVKPASKPLAGEDDDDCV